VAEVLDDSVLPDERLPGTQVLKAEIERDGSPKNENCHNLFTLISNIMDSKVVWFSKFFKIASFVLCRAKEMYTGLKRHEWNR